MKKEDVDNVFPMFEGATETGKIKKSSLRKWVVRYFSFCFVSFIYRQWRSYVAARGGP